MSEELTMPRLSDTMEQGTIGRWLKEEGDEISEGEVIAEIETDKATMEFQAYADGTLLKILVGEGESAALGAPIAVVGEPGEDADGDGRGEQAQAADDGEAEEQDSEDEEQEQPDDGEAAAQPEAEQDEEDSPGDERGRAEAREDEEGGEPQPREQEAAEERGGRRRGGPREAQQPAAGDGRATLRVSPIARRMADDAGVDLSSLAGRGSGPEGRVVKADVERLLREGGPEEEPERGATEPARQPAAAPPAGAELRELTPMLKAVARRMAEAKATVPHFYVTSEIDMTAALELRRELNARLEDTGEKISVNDLIVKACATALMQHPQAHRSFVDGRHAYHEHANVGIAVALDDGLIVPVVREADAKGLRQVAREARELIGRAREGKLKQREIEGGTFTVSNMGMFDVAQFAAIINPPESTILAVGSAVERPVVVDGEVVVRPIMAVTLSCDHRACSGTDGARLLQTLKGLLEGGPLLLA